MEKINLSVERSFSDLITATINLVKQEFVPFIRAFAVIGFPVVLLMVFLIKDLLLGSIEMSYNPQEYGSDSFMKIAGNSILTGLASMLIVAWVQLFSICYLRVYWDHYRGGIEERITVGEVFGMMVKKFGLYLGWTFFYFIIVVVGCCFFIVPGIYFGVALTFGVYLIIIKDKGLGSLMTEAMAMAKGNWWKIFGYALVLQLLVGVVAYVFSIPYVAVTMTTAFTGEAPGVYELTFSLLFAYLGQYTLYTILFLGIGMFFFSRSEEMEHTTLLSRIEELGTSSENKTDESVD